MRTLALHVQHPPRAVKPPWFDYHPCRVDEARLIVILARAISDALWEDPVPSGLDTLELAVPRERMREVAETLDLLYPACFIWREPRGKPYTDVRDSGHASLLCMVERYDGFFNWLCWASNLEVPLYLDTETAMLLAQHSRLHTLTIRLQYEVRESWRQLYYLLLCDQTHSTLKLLVLSCPERAQRRRLEEDLGVCLPYMSLKLGTKAGMFSCTDPKDPRGSCLKSHYLGNSHDKTTCPRCCVLFNQQYPPPRTNAWTWTLFKRIIAPYSVHMGQSKNAASQRDFGLCELHYAEIMQVDPNKDDDQETIAKDLRWAALQRVRWYDPEDRW